MTTATTTKAPRFKSSRAAKSAYTKAEKAWKAKQTEGWIARDTYRETFRLGGSMETEQYEALKATEARCEAEADVLFEAMRVIYTAAAAQEFWLPTWYFGQNATRDLIRANID